MRRVVALAVLLAAAPTAAPVPAQQPTPAEAAEALLREERVRATVEAALDSYMEGVDEPRDRLERMLLGADAIVELGPEAAPYLVNEAEQGLYTSYYFATYALGRLGGDAARAGLREAIRRAENEAGNYAVSRKGWAAWCLAMTGDAEAAALVNSGKHLGGTEGIYRNVSAVEAVALFLGAEAIPALVADYRRLADSTEVPAIAARRGVVEALGRTGAPAAHVPLLEVLRGDAVPTVRRAAALALGRLPAAAGAPATEALVATLADDDPSVRHAAATSLGERLADDAFGALAARLEVEDNAFVRGRLYRSIARIRPSEALAALAPSAWRGDATDRLELVTALRELDDPLRVRLLAQGAGDPDRRVGVAAVLGLGEIAGEDAAERLVRIAESAPEAVAETALEQLLERRDPRVARLITERIVDGDLARPVVDASIRDRVLRGLDMLVRADAAQTIDALTRALERQNDQPLILGVRNVIDRLKTIRANGDDVERWVAASRSEDPATRATAYRHLARIGGDAAARALVAALDRVTRDERPTVLRALGGIDTAATRNAVRHVLSAPEYDRLGEAPARAEAAWAARRLGGDAMRDLLLASIERRRGRDAYPFLALAQLDAAAAREAYRRYRLDRLRAVNFDLGSELGELDRLAATIDAGRSPDAWDLPPDEIRFR